MTTLLLPNQRVCVFLSSILDGPFFPTFSRPSDHGTADFSSPPPSPVSLGPSFSSLFPPSCLVEPRARPSFFLSSDAAPPSYRLEECGSSTAFPDVDLSFLFFFLTRVPGLNLSPRDKSSDRFLILGRTGTISLSSPLVFFFLFFPLDNGIDPDACFFFQPGNR